MFPLVRYLLPVVCLALALATLGQSDASPQKKKKPARPQPPPAKEPADPLPEGAIVRLGKAEDVIRMAFSPDSQTLATGHSEEVRFWDVSSGEQLRSIRRPAGAHSLAFSRDGKAIVLGDGLLGIVECDVARVRTLRAPLPAKDFNNPDLMLGGPSVSVAPDGKTLAACHPYGEAIQFWDLATGKELKEREAKIKAFWEGKGGDVRDWIKSVVFSPTGTMVAAGGCYGPSGSGGSVYVWDTTGKWLQVLHGDRDVGVGTISFSGDGRLLACAAIHEKLPDQKLQPANPFGEDEGKTIEVIRVWEVASGKELFHLWGKRLLRGVVALSPDGRVLAWSGTGDDDHICLRDTTTGKELSKFRYHNTDVLYAVFSPDGKTLATTTGSQIFLWDVSGKRPPAWKVPELSPKALDQLWADLANADVAVARRALWTLVAAPKQSAPLLRERLKPVPAVDAKRIAQLIADLDSADFDMREQATAELERLGLLAEPALRQALASRPSLEVRKRAEELLKKLERPITSPETLRNLRAIEALEHIGIKEAKALLQELAQGAPAALETQAAKETLHRLEKRLATSP